MTDLNSLVMDDGYEFSAPRFYDFINGETEEDKSKAELWFETSISYAPSRTFGYFEFHCFLCFQINYFIKIVILRVSLFFKGFIVGLV